MTTAPTRPFIDNHSPTTRFAGQFPAAPKPVDAANLAALHSDNPPSDVDPPVPNAAAALLRRETAPTKAPHAARPIAKSP
jgi:hypothetical protein